METPAKAVKRLRKERKLTQEDLAKRLGISRLSVNELERNRRNITADMALRLEKVFGVDAMGWLIAQAHVDLDKVRNYRSS
jgi:addiction module HigA family antidote